MATQKSASVCKASVRKASSRRATSRNASAHIDIINNAANGAVNSPSEIDLKELLRRGWERPEVPIAIIGDPGMGKTALVEEFCREYDLPLVKVLASSMDETDVSGILVYDKLQDAAVMKRNELFLRLMDRGGVLFLDEFNTARKEVADTLLTVIQSRELPGGYKLPANTLIVAAMNDADQCDNYELSPAMRNRFLWVEKRAKIEDWAAFELGEDKSNAEYVPLGKQVTQAEHRKWFRQEGHGEDKKAVLKAAITKGLNLSSNETIVGSQTFTSPRSLSNLIYWTRDADDMIFWAPCFLAAEDVTVLQAVSAKALNNVANSVFDNGFFPMEESNVEEIFRMNIKSGVLSRVKEAVPHSTDLTTAY